MTGTSLDGLDIAIVCIVGNGLQMSAHLLKHRSYDLGPIGQRIHHMVRNQPMRPSDFMIVARELGQTHARAILDLAHDVNLDAVVVHGQTIWHMPEVNMSWQLIDPWPIARVLNVPVCYDLRQADLIAGGHGAPITPMSDWIMYRDAQRRRWIVNLGGICNITYLPPTNDLSQIRGMDIGPCNLLLDGLMQKLYSGQAFDADGQRAKQGCQGIDLLPQIRKAPFFQRPLPRTTGREDFDEAWVMQLLDSVEGRADDILLTAVDAVARLLAAEVSDTGDQLILAGGGARHPVLVDRIREHTTQTVLLSDELGIDVSAREAMAMAVLGALSQDGIPITLPQITGAVKPGVAGTWINI